MGQHQVLNLLRWMLHGVFWLCMAAVPAHAATTWQELDRAYAARPGTALKSALAILSDTGLQDDRQQQLRTLWQVARGGLLGSDVSISLQHIDKAIALAEALGEREAHAWLVYTKGALLTEAHRYEAAKPFLQQADRMAEQLGLDNLRSWIQLARGNVLHREKIFSEAVEWMTRAYAQFEMQGDRFGMARALHSLGHLSNDEATKAKFTVAEYSGEDKMPAEERRQAIGEALKHGKEDNRKGIDYLMRALQLVDGDAYPHTALQIHLMLMPHFAGLGQNARFVALSGKAMELARTMESRYYEGVVHARLGAAFRHMKKNTEALTHLDLALSLFPETPSWGRTLILLNKAIVLNRFKRTDEARELLSQVDQIMTTLAKQGDTQYLFSHRTATAGIYASMDDHRQAYRQLLLLLEQEAVIRRKESETAVAEQKTRFEVHLKDAENARLRAEQQEAETRRLAELRVKDAENARLRAQRQEIETREQAEIMVRDAENARLRLEQQAAETERQAIIRVKDAENGRLRAQQKQADTQRLVTLTATLLGLLLLGGFVVTLRKRTAVARRESQHHKALAEAQSRASLAKSQFLANMSHELRTPLNAVLGFSRLLMRESALPDRARSDLGVILRSGEHLYTLINQVLDLSKIEAGRITLHENDLDLYGLLDELADTFSLPAKEKNLQLDIDAAPDVRQYVRTDAVKLRQVLLNLLSNALKFTREGRVALRIELAPAGLRFAVTDTGPGISADELALLGQAFVQADAGRQSQEGTGLGLAISRSFVQLMGGTLRIASRLGEGTTVEFDLPVRTASPSASIAVPAWRMVTGVAPGQPLRRVLAVDDQQEGRQLLVRLLSPLNCEVREAANGQQALECWESWKPDLILMDMRMPVMDGREATRRIRAAEETRSVVIIALTASSFEDEKEQILADGCDDYLRKPFREEAMFDLLQKHLGMQFLHADDGAAHPIDLDAARMARLPEAVQTALREALARFDVAAIDRAVEAIRDHDAAAAQALAELARGFKYDRMRMLIAHGTDTP